MMKAVLFDLDGTLLPMDQDVFIQNYFKRLAVKMAPLGYDADRLIKAVWSGTAAMVGNDGEVTNDVVFWKCFTDIFEVFGSTNQVVSNLHKWGGQDPKTKRARHVMLPGGEGSCKRAFSLNAKTVNGEFHVYGFEWTPENMSFFVDGNRYATYPIDADHEFSPHELVGMECFHDFHSVILNDEIFMENHGWCPKGAALAPDAPLPIEYTVDWIRLYQKTGEELKIAKDGLFPQGR